LTSIISNIEQLWQILAAHLNQNIENIDYRKSAVFEMSIMIFTVLQQAALTIYSNDTH